MNNGQWGEPSGGGAAELPAVGPDGEVLTADAGQWKSKPSQGINGQDPGFIHNQIAPSTTWTVVHNLGREPLVQAFDLVGRLIAGGVTHLDDNVVTISFQLAVAGTARCV